MAQKTKYDVAVWHKLDDGETYAFPLGVKDAWGGEVVPLIDNAGWQYNGTLPKGQPVAEVKPVTGNRVRCKLAGKSVNTADWAIES
jgi:hypothetical protein